MPQGVKKAIRTRTRLVQVSATTRPVAAVSSFNLGSDPGLRDRAAAHRARGL
jgi:hypothetical protein